MMTSITAVFAIYGVSVAIWILEHYLLNRAQRIEAETRELETIQQQSISNTPIIKSLPPQVSPAKVPPEPALAEPLSPSVDPQLVRT